MLLTTQQQTAIERINELDKLKIVFADASLKLEIAQAIYKSARNNLIEALNRPKNETKTDIKGS